LGTQRSGPCYANSYTLSVDVYWERAEVYRTLGRRDEAGADWKRAAELVRPALPAMHLNNTAWPLLVGPANRGPLLRVLLPGICAYLGCRQTAKTCEDGWKASTKEAPRSHAARAREDV
jgi:hypothetical protein